MTRSSLMILALLVLHLLLGVLCLVVARGELRSRALRLWGSGLLMYAAGLLITLLTFIPVDVAKVVGNALIAFAPVLTVSGLLQHSESRLRPRWVAAAYALTMLPIVANHLGGSYVVAIDMLAPGPLANVLFVIAAVALLRTPAPDAKAAARFLAGILVFCVTLWTVRLALIWVSLGGTNDRERTDLTVAFFVIAQLVIAVAATLGLFWVEVRKMEAALRRLANTDVLTGLPNRRATMQRFDQEAARAARHGRPFSIAVFDVDHFKRVNDTYGHGAGDQALKHVAGVLTGSARDFDIVGRVGGEEFVVILTEEGSAGAAVAANRLRESVAARALPVAETSLNVTLSGGVATYPQDGLDWDALFHTADRRLYEAKGAGRNRVVGADALDAVDVDRLPTAAR